jgi:hypothetical protein
LGCTVNRPNLVSCTASGHLSVGIHLLLKCDMYALH